MFINLTKSYLIKAGRTSTKIKSLDSNSWAIFNSSFNIVDDKNVVLELKSGNLINPKNSPIIDDRNSIAVNPLNHPRCVIDNFFDFEKFIKEALTYFKNYRWKSTVLFFQLDYHPKGGITLIELRAIRDALEHCGASRIYLINSMVSETEIDIFFAELNKNRNPNKVINDSRWNKFFW